MAYTIEQYNALQAAIATGALEVEYADNRTKFRSLAEMEQILSKMKGELGLNTSAGNSRVVRTQYSKGLKGC
jgi:hypothetical protein